MRGWIVPPPKAPTKTAADYARERERKVRGLESRGLLKSPRIKAALLKVPREEFIPLDYRDYAYCEVPLPLPGAAATISCRIVTRCSTSRSDWTAGIASSSSALARAMVLLSHAKSSAMKASSCPSSSMRSPTDSPNAISNVPATATSCSCSATAGWDIRRLRRTTASLLRPRAPRIPAPLIEQLTTGGRVIAPLREDDRQVLTLITKQPEGVRRETMCDVLYVALRGEYGTEASATAFPPDDAMAAD